MFDIKIALIDMKIIFVALLVCACLIGALACSAQNGKSFENLDNDAFETLLQDKNIHLLDVRTPSEYAAGHIPGSINIDVFRDDFAEQVDTLLDSKRPVAVYCKSGRRSRNAAKTLTDKGYKVYNLDNGITGWVSAGKGVAKM